MNNRENLFFKNVELYRSMSLRKKIDKEEIDKRRKQYAKEYMDKMKKKKTKTKGVLERIITFFVG
jgi:hypothetical protein